MRLEASPNAACSGRTFSRRWSDRGLQVALDGHELEAPLEGPAYLRSSENTLPDLVFALSGHGIEVDVDGRIDSAKGGIRGTFVGVKCGG